MTKPELKHCPFCDSVGEAEHKESCYFKVLASLRAAKPGDISLVPDLLDAWNRRATIQPTAAPQSAMAAMYCPDCDMPVGEWHTEPCGLNRAVTWAEAQPFPVAPADAVRDARDLALEEAAKLCDMEAAASSLPHTRKSQWQSEVAGRCATSIRAKFTPKEPAK